MPAPRLLLLGALTLLVLAGAGGGYLALRSPEAEAAGETPAAASESAQIATGPEYDRCLALLRTDADAARGFAAAWELRGGGEGARHCVALALLAQGEAAAAAERLEALAGRSRAAAAVRAGVYAQAGQAWMLAGDPDRTFAATTLGLVLLPGDADLLIDRAAALGSLGRYAEALVDVDAALQRQPERAEAWVFRAAALRRLDRAREGRAAVDRALALAPENAEALLERGILRQIAGDLAGARGDWRRAISVAPDSPAADLAQQNLALNEAGPQRR